MRSVPSATHPATLAPSVLLLCNRCKCGTFTSSTVVCMHRMQAQAGIPSYPFIEPSLSSMLSREGKSTNRGTARARL